MTVPVLAAENLSVDYRIGREWRAVLSDISLSLEAGEIHGLVGESGSGKTTLGMALMRYLDANARITAGRVLLDGDDLVPKTTAELRDIWGRLLNLVPQNPLAALNPSYPIGDQIGEVTRRHAGLTPREAWEQAVAMLRKVKIADPDVIARRYPHQLSGGMRQRVSIAMALSTQPRLLVLDEPTTALDVTTQAVILDLFRELIRGNHAAALYISHDLATIAQLCERVTVLYAGEVMETAPVRALYTQPLHPYTQGLLASLPHKWIEGNETRLPVIPGVAPSLAERPSACVFAPRCPLALAVCHAEKPPLEATPDGRSVRCHRWQEIADGLTAFGDQPAADSNQLPADGGEQRTVGDPRPPVLMARGVTKHFGEGGFFARLTGMARPPVQAVDDVSLHVNAKSTLGLVGESGSGKTTLARLIVGLEPADRGELQLMGVDLPADVGQRPQAALRQLQMVMQNPNEALNPYQTVGQAIGRPLRRLEQHLTEPQIKARVADLLESVRLSPSYAERVPAELSGGEKQRVAIARAFAANPALIVADEPTSALDVSVQAVVLNLLKDLRASHGSSYLLISHDLDVVAYLAEWICVMYLGQIVEQGKAAHVYGAPSHPYTEALVSAVPVADPDAPRKGIRLDGEVPSARSIPTGCRFHTRCPRCLGDVCISVEPPIQDAGDGHLIRCHIPLDELARLQADPLSLQPATSSRAEGAAP
ncbi:MAG: ABC transporter ATP-binding protein [Chloroflexi bacterium]|nr:ABC transporter ATP-binding protein [Chloroflexota bacterium]